MKPWIACTLLILLAPTATASAQSGDNRSPPETFI